MAENETLNLNNNDSNEILKQLALEYLKESKRRRRWGFVYRLLILLLILFFIVSFMPHSADKTLAYQPHVGIIDINGTIFDQSASDADEVAKSLRKAYRDSGTRAIILKINSPGGSPVQADYIYNEVMRYRKRFPDIKVYAVCTDMCASAAYYVASSADAIYANPSSLVGSIGVLYNGFGFVGTMGKLGVERRLIMSGKYKGFLDPFSPLTSEQQQLLQTMLDSVHKQFEDKVIQGRGNRLKISAPDLFSGLVWTGTQAKELGLIDDFGSTGMVARDIVKVNTMINYSDQTTYFEKFAKKIGVSVSSELLAKFGIVSNAGFQSRVD